MRKVLKVTISGECGVGKSTLARLVVEAARFARLEAIMDDEDTERVMGKPDEFQRDALKELARRETIVLVETVQTIRGSNG